jgi:hypothetical protein
MIKEVYAKRNVWCRCRVAVDKRSPYDRYNGRGSDTSIPELEAAASAVESETEGIFRWSRSRKEFLGGVGGVGRNF